MKCPFCKLHNIEKRENRHTCNDCSTSWTDQKLPDVVKKVKRRNGLDGDAHVFEFYDCPWCGHNTNVSNPVNFCSGCYTNYYVMGRYVYFDKQYKPKNYVSLALAKAITKAGGVRIGGEK